MSIGLFCRTPVKLPKLYFISPVLALCGLLPSVMRLRMSLASIANNSTGHRPAITRDASSDTVGYALQTLSAQNLRTHALCFAQDLINVASIHIGAAFKSIDAATVASSFLPVCPGPLLFVLIRANDDAACNAFSEA